MVYIVFQVALKMRLPFKNYIEDSDGQNTTCVENLRPILSWARDLTSPPDGDFGNARLAWKCACSLVFSMTLCLKIKVRSCRKNLLSLEKLSSSISKSWVVTSQTVSSWPQERWGKNGNWRRFGALMGGNKHWWQEHRETRLVKTRPVEGQEVGLRGEKDSPVWRQGKNNNRVRLWLPGAVEWQTRQGSLQWFSYLHFHPLLEVHLFSTYFGFLWAL